MVLSSFTTSSERRVLAGVCSGIAETAGVDVTLVRLVFALLALEADAERSARIRTEERADVAARVHDSVLQTLALIQRHAGEPRRVAALARRQERELRGWLYADRPLGDDGTSLVAALATAA